MFNISDKDMGYINKALIHASSSESVASSRVSAVLVLKNRIISVGTNQRKSHPLQAMYGKNKDSIFLHAEIDCINNALRRGITESNLYKSTIYIARARYIHNEFDSPLTWGMAKSCVGCSRALNDYNIKRVVYTTNDVGVCNIL